MTATTYEIPPSLRERIAGWLAENPGEHTGVDIWVKLPDDVPLQRVYNELGRMARNGEVTRRRDTSCCGPTVTVYSLTAFPCEG